MATSGDFQLEDYRFAFWVGLAMGLLGVLGELWGMAIFGGIIAVIGLINKCQWRKQRVWSELTSIERKKQLAGVIAFAILGIVLIVVSVVIKSQSTVS